MPNRSRSRPRGRPATDRPAARSQILDAVATLLESAPLSRPSLRSVAQSATVTPALIHYHFGDLPGLMRSLHDERATALLQPLLLDLQAGEPTAGAALARFLHKWTALTRRHAWLAGCLLQVQVEAVDSPLGCGAIVRAAVASAQQQGAVRGDLPAGYIALLLLSLGVMPHLAQTALGAGLSPESRRDSPSAATLTLQHLSVLQAGVAR